MNSLNAIRPGPTSVAATWALTRLFLGQLVTRSRIAVLGALGLMVALLGLVARTADDPFDAEAGIIVLLGLAIVVPIITLVFASATLGEMRSENTLVYLWLRPIPRWSIAAAASAATVAVTAPLSVAALVLSAVLSGEMSLIVPAIVAGIIAVVGYTGLFVTLGAGMNRGFLVGLGFIIVWEFLISRATEGFARLSVLGYSSSVVQHLTDIELEGGGALGRFGFTSSIIVPVGILVVGCALTTWLLARREVD